MFPSVLQTTRNLFHYQPAFPGIPQSLTTFTVTIFSHLSLVWDSLTNAHCLVLLLELQNLGNSESEVRFCGDADWAKKYVGFPTKSWVSSRSYTCTCINIYMYHRSIVYGFIMTYIHMWFLSQFCRNNGPLGFFQGHTKGVNASSIASWASLMSSSDNSSMVSKDFRPGRWGRKP